MDKVTIAMEKSETESNSTLWLVIKQDGARVGNIGFIDFDSRLNTRNACAKAVQSALVKFFDAN